MPAQCTAFVQYTVEIWSSIVCVEKQQEMSMSYLEKVQTEHDLQNWVLLCWMCKCYSCSCIFINQNLHEGISHSIFCREESRNTISLWKLRYLRFVQPAASCYSNKKVTRARWCKEFKLLQIGWATVTVWIHSPTYCSLIQFKLACY